MRMAVGDGRTTRSDHWKRMMHHDTKESGCQRMTEQTKSQTYMPGFFCGYNKNSPIVSARKEALFFQVKCPIMRIETTCVQHLHNRSSGGTYAEQRLQTYWKRR